MEISDAKSFINLVTEEARRREALLKDADPDYAYDQWMFTDLPLPARPLIAVSCSNSPPHRAKASLLRRLRYGPRQRDQAR